MKARLDWGTRLMSELRGRAVVRMMFIEQGVGNEIG